MIRYILKRLLLIIPVLLCVAVLIFTIMYFVPGDPAQIILGSNATAEEITQLRDQMGLNDPYFVQLGRFLYDLVHLDFGESYIYGTSVASELIARFPITFLFAIVCMVIRVFVGTPLGIVAAVHQNGFADRACMIFAMLGVSLPGFWLAMMLVLLFSVQLGWLPPYGIDSMACWVMPVIAGSISGIAGQARQTRSSMLEVIRSDYVTTARAKGLSEQKILYKHALPNGLIPIIQVIGNGLGNSLVGALVIENVFSIPGMGTYLTRAVSTRDYPVVQSVVVLLALTFSLIMLAVDLGFAFADPRIKAQYEGKKLKLCLPWNKKKTVSETMDEVCGQEEDYLVEWNKFQEQRDKEELDRIMADAGEKDSSKAPENTEPIQKQEARPLIKEEKTAKPKRNSREGSKGQWKQIWRRLCKNKLAVAGLAIFVIFVLGAVFADFIAPYGFNDMDPANIYALPSLKHLCGTDNLGRDIFSRLLYGGRYSLGIGVCATCFGLAVGVILGSLAGYFGGMADLLLLRFMDIFQAIPGLLLSIVISTALGGGFFNTVLALGVGLIPSFCRMTRAQFLAIRGEEYLEAAQAINCSRASQIFKHMLPNAVSPLIVNMTMGVGITIMSAAQLSYIGLGVQPPTPEWGAMLTAAKEFMRLYPHMIIFPGIFITLVVLAVNLFGDGLRDALDPKLKN